MQRWQTFWLWRCMYTHHPLRATGCQQGLFRHAWSVLMQVEQSRFAVQPINTITASSVKVGSGWPHELAVAKRRARCSPWPLEPLYLFFSVAPAPSLHCVSSGPGSGSPCNPRPALHGVGAAGQWDAAWGRIYHRSSRVGQQRGARGGGRRSQEPHVRQRADVPAGGPGRGLGARKRIWPASTTMCCLDGNLAALREVGAIGAGSCTAWSCLHVRERAGREHQHIAACG